MVVSDANIIETLKQLIDESQVIEKSAHNIDMTSQIKIIDMSLFIPWKNKVLSIIRNANLNVPDIIVCIENARTENYESFKVIKNNLIALIDLLKNEIISSDSVNNSNWNYELDRIFNKFHKIARQLKRRYNDRTSLEITDEYDVQDLLHALLLLFFNDVRTEEWIPSYAGGSARADFLLKEYQTIIEVKKTRQSMNERQLGDELIVDCQKYQAHPDCKTIYCFVYDPDGYISNPIAVKNDLEKAHKGFVKVFIRPDN